VSAAAFGGWGFLWFLGASLLVPCIQGAGLMVHLLRTLKWGLGWSGFSPASEVRGMLRSSLYFSFPQFGLALVQSAPAIAISVAAGSSAVTGYTLLARLFGPFQQGQILLLNPVWPAYIEAHARGDHAWIGQTFRRTGAAFAALSLGVGVCAWGSARILGVWIGPSAVAAAAGLAAVTALWCILQMAVQPLMFLLIGIGRLRPLAWAATPGLVASTLALFWAARAGSVKGVLEAGSAGLCLAILPLAYEAARTVRPLGRGEASP
jgi:O-antigen/teichoic acid export membrane protein